MLKWQQHCFGDQERSSTHGSLTSVSSVPLGPLLYLPGLQISLSESRSVGLDQGLTICNKDQNHLRNLINIQFLRPDPQRF